MMHIVRNILKSVFSPLGIINGKAIKGKLPASVVLVLITALTGSILAPVLYYLNYKNKFEINIGVSSLLIMFLACILTWIAACILFWLLSAMLKKQVGFETIVSTWGFSYVPNFLCIIAFSLLQLKPGLFTGYAIFGFLINTFFIMLLVWKAIYFFIEMKFVIRTTGYELLMVTVISGIIFGILMGVGFSLGIQIPML